MYCHKIFNFFPLCFIQVLWLYLLYNDFQRSRLFGSNGRFVSFMQSVESVYKYKLGRNILSSTQSCRKNFFYVAYIISMCFVLKFAPGTLTSVWLGLTPTWLQGRRHILSFFIALCWIQFSPRKLGFSLFYNNIACRMILNTAAAIYKLRKLIFLMRASNTSPDLLSTDTFALALWECEGSSIARRLEKLVMGATCAFEVRTRFDGKYWIGAYHEVCSLLLWSLYSLVAVSIVYISPVDFSMQFYACSFSIIWYRYNHRDILRVFSIVLSSSSWVLFYIVGPQTYFFNE